MPYTLAIRPGNASLALVSFLRPITQPGLDTQATTSDLVHQRMDYTLT